MESPALPGYKSSSRISQGSSGVYKSLCPGRPCPGARLVGHKLTIMAENISLFADIDEDTDGGGWRDIEVAKICLVRIVVK